MKLNENKWIFAVVLFLASCRGMEFLPDVPAASRTYLHLSHTRAMEGNRLDENVIGIPFDNYQMIWLGGDLTLNTSIDFATLAHVDSILRIGDPNTLWALGNHDYWDRTGISQFTHRPAYFSYYSNGLVFLVLDTQEDHGNISGAQMQMVRSVLDTIEEASHLVVLHHKLIWMPGNQELEGQIGNISNGPAGDCSYCLSPNNFYSELYPILSELTEKGIRVLCVGGDIGTHTGQFEYQTAEGIYFLASGISSGNDSGRVIVFHHDMDEGQLRWEFLPLSKL